MSRNPTILPPLPFTFNAVLQAVADEQAPEVQTLAARPFLKWVGGKRSVLPVLQERMPKTYGGYHELFLGGGALFFAAQPAKAYLSDVNFRLILTFQAVRDNPTGLIELLKEHTKAHSKTYFARARDLLSSETDATKIAALFIYLNKTCFNGLYRVNKTGLFNVPIGSYKEVSIFDEELIKADSKALQGVSIEMLPFSQHPIIREDFYYLDPPYHLSYALYDGSGFGEDAHRELAEYCKEIHDAKAYFMVSNSDTELVRTLYAGFKIEQISAWRTVSCKAKQRGRENELLIRNY